jgi:RNA polymerase sigma-70 factor (ECF subfamily)
VEQALSFSQIFKAARKGGFCFCNISWASALYSSKLDKDYMDLDKEKELVARAATDSAAFGELYDSYFPQIFGYALKRTGSVALAQDIVSEVFLKAFKSIEKYEWRALPFSAWLYRIASNEISSQYRKLKFFTSSFTTNTELEIAGGSRESLEAELVAAQDILDEKREMAEIRKCLLSLPNKYQEALSLRYFEGLGVSDICAIMNKKEGTVRSLLSRGTQMLRSEVNKDERSILDITNGRKEK